MVMNKARGICEEEETADVLGGGRWLWAARAEECVLGRYVFVYNATSCVPLF